MVTQKDKEKRRGAGFGISGRNTSCWRNDYNVFFEK